MSESPLRDDHAEVTAWLLRRQDVRSIVRRLPDESYEAFVQRIRELEWPDFQPEDADDEP